MVTKSDASDIKGELNPYDIHFDRAADPKTMEDFWAEQAKLITWIKEPKTILNRSEPPFFGWFTDGELNTCYNCIDRHLAERGDQPALIYESPITNSSKTYTYKELKEHTAKFAGVLANHGVVKGDRVIIYMPMIPEAIFATLACARIGAIHSIVFGGFAAKELASRILDAEPKVIVSATCGIEPHKVVDYKKMLDEAIKIANLSTTIKKIIVAREQLKVTLIEGVDFDFYEELSKAKEVDPVPVLGKDPLYILYTSGTTGSPKGIVRDNGGNAVALAYSMKYIFGLKPGDVYMATSDIGWVVGHSYIIYGPLINGSATVLFEGKPNLPDAGIVWRTAEKYKVRGIYSSPTAMRAVRKEDPEGKHIKQADLSNVASFSMAGERVDIPTCNWLLDCLPKTCLLNDNYWQTETGWSIGTNFVNLHTFPVKPGSTTKPAPGMRVTIIDEDCHHLPPNTLGNVCIQLPMPPSFMTTLYKNDKAFVDRYLKPVPCFYFTGDAGFIDDKGYLHVTTRVDDIINTAGHRLSTSQMEEVLTGHKDIVEAAVLSAKDELKGEIPVGFVVLKTGVDREKAAIVKELIAKIREDIGPVASFQKCMIVEKLPKTRSGKILRNILRAIVDGEEPKIPPTIEDESVIEPIKAEAMKNGLCKKVNIQYEEDLKNN